MSKISVDDEAARLALMAWARNVQTGRVWRKAVLMALARECDADGKCSIDINAIAFHTEVPENQVRQALATLIYRKIIYVRNDHCQLLAP